MESKLKIKTMAMLGQKCPICGKGHVYQRSDHFLQIPVMNENCPECNYHFEREPGYFLGAMYVSYGLAVFEGIIAFLLAILLFDGLSPLTLSLTVVGVILGFSFLNYRLSRVIWMNIFPN
jgi:hypothetical protein